MPRINEATDTDLKVIERLQQIGWKGRGFVSGNNISMEGVRRKVR